MKVRKPTSYNELGNAFSERNVGVFCHKYLYNVIGDTARRKNSRTKGSRQINKISNGYYGNRHYLLKNQKSNLKRKYKHDISEV